jgi:hypothetical protein
LNRKLLNTFRQLPANDATIKGSFPSIATSPTASASNAMGALKNKRKGPSNVKAMRDGWYWNEKSREMKFNRKNKIIVLKSYMNVKT